MSNQVTRPDLPELLISVPRAAKRVSLSAKTVHKMIREGKFPVKRIGKRIFVPTKALEEWARPDELDSGV